MNRVELCLTLYFIFVMIISASTSPMSNGHNGFPMATPIAFRTSGMLIFYPNIHFLCLGVFLSKEVI